MAATPAPQRWHGVTRAGGGQISADDLGGRRHCGEPVLVAPGGEVSPVARIGSERGRCVGRVLVGLRFGERQRGAWRRRVDAALRNGKWSIG